MINTSTSLVRPLSSPHQVAVAFGDQVDLLRRLDQLKHLYLVAGEYLVDHPVLHLLRQAALGLVRRLGYCSRMHCCFRPNPVRLKERARGVTLEYCARRHEYCSLHLHPILLKQRVLGLVRRRLGYCCRRHDYCCWRYRTTWRVALEWFAVQSVVREYRHLLH